MSQTEKHEVVYPFTAIVDQEPVKRALILNAIDPSIGGVLISGPKGTGKSLIVRAFSQVLPEIEVVADCPFRCSPSDPTNMCPSCLSKLSAGEELTAKREPMRIVQVPLSITDDMLVGSLDMDKALEEGIRALQPGLLAEANQNILYIDEVNLLPDHITDSILDAAASGWNVVEREGISVQHPSRFILIGTMNPEEGELRPQILDRFGLYAETRNVEDPEQRAQILNRNEEFARDPFTFISRYKKELEELRSRVERARFLLPKVEVPKEVYWKVADTCSRLKVDGFRPDIVALKAARALAAFNEREAVLEEDMVQALELTLGHRTRRSGLIPPPSKGEIRRALGRSLKPRAVRGFTEKLGGILLLPGEMVEGMRRRALLGLITSITVFILAVASSTLLIETARSLLIPTPPSPPVLLIEIAGGLLLALLISLIAGRSRSRRERAVGVVDLSKITLEARGRLLPTGREAGLGSGSGSAKVTYGIGPSSNPEYGAKILSSMEAPRKVPSGVKPWRSKTPGGAASSGGRRSRAVSSLLRGRYAWYAIPKGRPRDIALIPTIISAAQHQQQLGQTRAKGISIRPEDLRVKVREYHAPYSIVLLVDMSLSMIDSMEGLVRAIYSFHREVYRRRDRVGLVVFKGSRAYTLQHPTSNLELVVKKLREVGASDFTPMAAGLLEAWKVLKREKLRNRDAIPTLIVVSDGIVNVPLDPPISPLTRRRYTSEAQADCFDVAKLLVKEGFKVHIVNTKHTEGEQPPSLDERWRLRLTPTQFLMELARAAKGEYHNMTLTPRP
ncbi:MAG: ATP-binding protein [Candidatus Bathyarchaeia archaeon]